MNIERKIRLFFISYGKLLFVCITTISIFIFTLKSLDNIVKEKKEAQLNSLAQNQITEEEKNIIQEQKKQISTEKEYIKQFIEYCNTEKVEEAYNMLSETCKREKYSSIQNFSEQYINKIFNIKINDYSIQKANDTYKATLIKDALVTGKTDSTVQTTYKVEGNLEGIYIIN